MKVKMLILGLVCLFFISGCEQQLPTTPDITGEGYPAPYDLGAAVISSSRIDLEWKNGKEYSLIEIYRKFDDYPYIYFTWIGGDNESWEDVNCMPETQYCYRIRGIFLPGAPGDSGKTDYSNEVCGTTHVY